MAWQLIYTSAPRLLEAGRTGFGTVARHRAVSGMLTSSVERFSQFARLPGHDPRRVVHTYRILTVGSGTYHVFSCLQDAGSDYTGRTNHIAHHLIAEPREIRALSATGQTPADVLLAMAWRASWSEGPRYLDPAEEVDLSSLATSTSRAWAAATGNPAHARLLWTREALKGCYLLLPAGTHALELFREALLIEPGQAWQTSFTTCLEPNDDVADFRWVGVSSSSPMRGQVETSNRLVLDLTQPARLPTPPEPEMPAPAPEAAMPPSAPEPSLLTREPPKERLRPSKSQTDAASTMGDWSPETSQQAAKSSKSVIIISLVIAVMLIATVAGGLLWRYNHQTQERAAYDKAIAKTWKDHQLSLNDTRRWLEDQADVNAGKTLLQSHEEFFQSMRPLLSKPGKGVKLTLPAEHQDDLGELTTLLEEWVALHVKPWAKLQASKATVTASGIQTEYRKWQNSRNAKWTQLESYFDSKTIPPVEDDLTQPLAELAKERLHDSGPEHGTHSDWKQLFALLNQRAENTDPDVQKWLNLWADLDGENANAAAQKNHADKSLPKWLHDKAVSLKQKHDKEQEGKMAEKDKPGSDANAKQPPKQAVAIEDADSTSAKNDIYILLLQPNEDLAGKLTGLKVEADMQLYVGGAWDAHPRPEAGAEDKPGVLKKWMATSLDSKKEIKFGPRLIAQLTEMIQFSDGKLISIPENDRQSSGGIRMVARSKDAARVLFDLRLIPISQISAKPVFTQTIESSLDNTAALTLRMPEGFLKRLHVVGQASSVYSLRHDGAASEQKVYELRPTGDSAFTVLSPQTKTSTSYNTAQIKQQISELEAGIKKDEADLAKNEASNSPPRLKAENKANYEKAKSDKTLKILTLQAQLQSMEGTPTSLHFDLMPGGYTLLVGQPNIIELCKLAVVPAAKSSNSKPPNP